MNAYSYININNPCVRSYYIYSTGPLHPPKLLLDTSHWSCFLTWGNSVCVVAERFSYYCLSSQWTIVKKKPALSFLLWIDESFWNAIVSWGSWPRGFAWKDHDRVFRHEPCIAFFVTSSDVFPGCVTVYLCAVHNRVSYKECVLKRLQEVLPLML